MDMASMTEVETNGVDELVSEKGVKHRGRLRWCCLEGWLNWRFCCVCDNKINKKRFTKRPARTENRVDRVESKELKEHKEAHHGLT